MPVTLRDRLARFAPDLPLLHNMDGPLTTSDLMASSTGPSHPISGGALLIGCSDLALALRAILQFEGGLARIGFCAPTLGAKQKDDLARAGEFDAALLDPGETLAQCPSFNSLPALKTYLGTHFSAGLSSLRPTEWVMTTSGTTGVPKLVAHSLDSLTVSTKTATQPAVNIRWGMAYDYTRFAGMQVVMQSLMSGACLLCPNLMASLSEQLAFLTAQRATHLSATPTLWRKILMTPRHQALTPEVITLGGEIVDQPLLDQLAKTFPKAKCIHIFASTEAGVGFSVRDGLAGFPETYLDDNPAGIDLRVVDDQLEVHNSRAYSTYLGEQDAITDSEGWVATGDLVAKRAGRIVFLGRANGTINVGGNKVMPEVVEATLMAHPRVVFARAFEKRSAFTGALVGCEVVLDRPIPANRLEDKKVLIGQIKAFASERLEAYQTPALVKFVDKIATNAAGKVMRK